MGKDGNRSNNENYRNNYPAVAINPFRSRALGSLRSASARYASLRYAAVAMVAYANGVPFIAFRSLSDLAGGEHGCNEMATFMGLASTNAAMVVQRFLQTWTPPR